MADDARGRRSLLQGGALLVGLVAFVAPAAAQDPTVFGLSPTVQAAGAVLFLVSICIILLVSLDSYTQRTTDVILERPTSTLLTGIAVTLVLVLPFLGLVAVTVLFDSLEVLSLVLLTVLATPLLALVLAATGIGLVAAGRRVTDQEGVVLIVVAAIAAPLGAFPIPFVVLGVVAAVFGMGAIFWDLRYGESELESQDRETYGQQHRYM